VFAGYIAYLSKNGVVSGYADGTFRPADPLSGYAFMKMLLGALGYDAVTEGYVGSNWGVNVAKQAVGISLNKGNDNFIGTAPVTREEAALYAFNTLKATMVEYKNASSITIGDITIANNVTATDVAQGSYSSYTTVSDGLLQFCEKNFPNLKLTTSTDELGRPTNKWSIKANTVGEYAKSATKTLVVADSGKTLQYFLDSSVYGGYTTSTDVVLSTTNVSYNGVKTTVSALNDLTSGYYATLTKGDVIYVYVNDNGKITDVDVAHYTYAKVDSVSSNVTTTEKDNSAAYRIRLVDFAGNNLGTSYDKYDDGSKNVLTGFNASTYTEDTSLAVAINPTTKAVVSSYIIEAVTGTPSAAKGEANGYITVAGTKYNYAGTPAGTYTGFDFAKSYAVYTTADGYVIAIDGVSTADLSDIYYVTSVYFDVVGGENVYYAQRVAMDGTVDTVKVEAGSVCTVLLSGTAIDTTSGSKNVFDSVSIAGSVAHAGLYTFNDDAVAASGNAAKQKANDGVLSFKKAGSDSNITVDYVVGAKDYLGNSATALNKDAASVTLNTAGKYYLNSETKYLAVSGQGSGIDVDTATGGMGFTSVGGSSYGWYVITTTKDTNTAVAVVVAGTSVGVTSVSKDMVYLAAEPKDQVGNKLLSTTLYDMTNGAEIAATITKDGVYDTQGFYAYEMSDGAYKLSSYVAGKLPDATYTASDKAEGYVENVVITSVYDKDGVSVISGSVGSVTLNDSKLSGVTIIDNRSTSTINSSTYNQKITSVTELKEAVKIGASVTADIYYNNGVTFIAVDSVSTGYALTIDSSVSSGVTISGKTVSGAVDNISGFSSGNKVAGGTTVTLKITVPTDTTAGTLKLGTTSTGDELASVSIAANSSGSDRYDYVNITMPYATTTLYASAG
jgi:hypothetical protein